MRDTTRPIECVVCAAVRASNGKVVTGHRHIDAIRALQEMLGYENEQPHGEDQGFVTSANRFVNREEGYRLHFPERTEPGELPSARLPRPLRRAPLLTRRLAATAKMLTRNNILQVIDDGSVGRATISWRD